MALSSSRSGGDELAASSFRAQDLIGIAVLVVEDDYENREATHALLKAAGAFVRSVASVAEALTLVRTSIFHVILADLGLPHEDGYALMRALRRRRIAIPVIAWTARDGADDRTFVRHAGFVLHLTKPVPPLDIVAAVALAARGRAEEFAAARI